MDYSKTHVSHGKHGVPFTTVTQFQAWFGVHPDHVGFVIGGKGATVKKISADCKCYIKIQDPNSFSGGFPWFLIKGSSESNVCEAYHRLRTIANEANRRVPRVGQNLHGQHVSQNRRSPPQAPTEDKSFMLAPVPKKKFKLKKPESKEQKPVSYTPQSPPYAPHSPVYAPHSPVNAPLSPSFKVEAALFAPPDSPVYAPHSPDYMPPKSPELGPRTPEDK